MRFGPWVLFCCSLALLQTAAASCSRPIRVSATPVGSSFVVLGDKQISGAYPDLLARVTQLTGCQFEYIPMPINRAFMMIKNGDLDLIPITVQTPERDQLGEFIPTSKNRLMLVYLKNNSFPWKTLAELRDAPIRINVVRGNNYGPAYSEWLADPRTRSHLEEVTTTDQIVQKLDARRADAVLSPLGGIAESINRFQLVEQIAYRPIGDVPPLRLGTYLSRKSMPAADQLLLKNTLNQLVRRGEYHRLLKQHYPAWAMASILPVR